MKLCKTSVFCSVLHSTQQHLSRLAGMAISAGLLGGGLIPMAFAEDEKRLPSIMEEIVVTANKRDESIMEVAQSVQYFSGDDLEASGVQNLDHIARLIPGVSLPASSASQTAAAAVNRG